MNKYNTKQTLPTLTPPGASGLGHGSITVYFLYQFL